MSNTEMTFIEQKKQQIAEQKRLVRNPGNQGLPEHALGIGDTNFAATAQTNKYIIGCEIACEQVYEPELNEKSEIIGFDGLLYRIANLVKIHQLGTIQDPTQVGFRKHLENLLKAEAGGSPTVTNNLANKI